jgi:hypothetical protein
MTFGLSEFMVGCQSAPIVAGRYECGQGRGGMGAFALKKQESKLSRRQAFEIPRIGRGKVGKGRFSAFMHH